VAAGRARVGGVRYVDLYAGVDLELTSVGGQMVQRLAARPGANLSAVRLRVVGADAVTVDADVLRLNTSAGEVAWPLLQAAGSNGEAEVQPRGAQTFDVGAPFLPARGNSQLAGENPESVGDNPADLLYGVFLGGSSYDRGYGIVVDGSGATYVTGRASSGDFPTTPGAFDQSYNGGFYAAFVVKLALGTSSFRIFLPIITRDTP